MADTRRRLNLMTGPARQGRGHRVVTLVVCVGAAAVLGSLILLGRTLGTLAPATAVSGADLAAWTWAPAVLYVLYQLLTTQPSSGRALVRPPDEAVLRTLPVSRWQVVTARLVLPTAGIALTVVTAVAAVVVPWFAATPAGRTLLPIALVHLCGVATCAAGLRILLVSMFVVRVVRVAHLPRTVLAAAGGWLVGVLAAPFVEALGGTEQSVEARLVNRLGRAVADGRPPLWTWLHVPERLWWAVAGYAAVAVTAALLTCVRMRFTERRDDHDAHGPARAPGSRGDTAHAFEARVGHSARRHALRVVLGVTWLRLRRADPAVTGGAARLQRLSILLGAACMGAAARLDTSPWQLTTPTLAGLFAAAALIATDKAVQVAGIEADGGCWDALRQSPGPTGAWPVAKAATSALAVFASIAPFCLGAAALCGVRGAQWPVVVMLLLSVAAVAGTASVVTWYLVPGAETFAGARVTRSPTADVVEGVVAAIILVPLTAGLHLNGQLTDGGATRILDLVLLIAVLTTTWAGALRVAGRNIATAPPSERTPSQGKEGGT
ncbi:hypothetical protein OHA84_35415 [Streptomyces sp. NBC_00513]|uniref:hypothetical protein n=1 Tax=unclassified Streptomyces TaxID=2593676 RepID=UPI00224DA31E|nr:hypothetical protein [Streptomyces sp. NBC_00424]MCX5071198.1 hypothetical protein [Streptomyces sp. NBC_00424]WUD45386.1 hypothetical protein OHA84_35415 [Streptomyces sp. NBC_00513]